MAGVAAPQPSVDELLATHAADIAGLRGELGALPSNWDDIWLLRFVLSWPDKDGAKRAETARQCIAWRAANAAMLADAAAGRPPPHADAIAPFVIAGFHEPSVHGEPLFIVRAGLSNPSAVMGVVSAEGLLGWLMYYKEVGFLQCDAETRRRRKVVKLIATVDLAHTQISMMDRRYFAVLGESGKLSEVVYPQSLLRSVVIHPPAAFYAMFSIVKLFMTKKALEKQSVCPGRSGAHGTAASCPFASRRFELASLPTFVGGSCRCTARGGCIGCTPNDETKPAPAEGRMGSVLVPARTHHDVLLTARAAGDTLAWSFSIADKGLEVSAWVTPDAGAVVPLLPAVKHSASEGPQSGTVAVPVPGTVTLRFCNGHSLLTGKRVTIGARIEPAGGPAPTAPAPALAPAAAAVPVPAPVPAPLAGAGAGAAAESAAASSAALASVAAGVASVSL